MNEPRVIVLILSYNGKALLDDAVPSYLQNDYPDFEVVVIDNGSVDGTREYVNEHWPSVTVLRTEENLGYSGGFNLGLAYAFKERNADYVLITNNDVRADSQVIRALVSVAESDPYIGFVSGKVYYFDEPEVLQTVGKYEDPVRWNGDHIGGRVTDQGQFEKVEERIFVDDIFTLVRREVYDAIGGYDITFRFQAEEFDWQARAKKLGYRIFFTPHAKIWHKESMTIGKQSSFKAYYDARNPMLVILKHREPEFFRNYFWLHFRSQVFRNSLVKVKQLRPWVGIRIWQGFFSGILWGIRNKRFTRHHFLRS